jgi:hypothetical protein
MDYGYVHGCVTFWLHCLSRYKNIIAYDFFFAQTQSAYGLDDRGLRFDSFGSIILSPYHRLCSLVVKVPSYRSWGPGFDCRRYHIFWEVVGLERGPLSLVRVTEELLEWKSSGSGQESRINGREDPLRWPRDTLCPQKLVLNSPTSGGRSVGIVHLRTKSHGV